ncbi:hypothetical protein CCACVL1_08325 [Corchorus capsularis]|uniref:Uncharacterized protein n=1 Tax=Corchorus capsularis TaxID=210143 RepID=A0A1R3J143_COCAP|nr:hypothetical protein CCACVL1_08325 [Corchorus capsularis]
MDIHECFEDEELGISKRRKRGPRNLKFDAKKQGKVVLQDENIQTIGDEQEDMHDEEEEEVLTLPRGDGDNHRDDNDNDLELRDEYEDLGLDFDN